MFQRYKHEIIISCFILVFIIAFLKLYSIILPFVIGLFLAIAVDPIISKIQKVFKNRNVATTVFLAGVFGIIILFLFFFTYNINRDFKRMNHCFSVITSENQTFIDNSTKKAKEFISNLYDFNKLEENIKIQADTLKKSVKNQNSSKIDTESIGASIDKIKSLFPTKKESTASENSSVSFIVLFFSSIFYFVLILYQYDYFKSVQKRYFSSSIKSKLSTLYDDFNQSFILFFKLRTKVVLLLTIPYAVTFTIMDMPGMILLTFIIAILSYIPFLQYLTLIPLALSCLVLSTETDKSFILLFGIVVSLFILMSCIDQLILTPRLMDKHIGINPVILVLTISIWVYLFGFFGVVIGIPLTSLLLIYLKRYLMESYRVVLQKNEEEE